MSDSMTDYPYDDEPTKGDVLAENERAIISKEWESKTDELRKKFDDRFDVRKHADSIVPVSVVELNVKVQDKIKEALQRAAEKCEQYTKDAMFPNANNFQAIIEAAISEERAQREAREKQLRDACENLLGLLDLEDTHGRLVEKSKEKSDLRAALATADTKENL